MKRRIFERFDSNAIDGDNDGLVQDATAFERPSKPRVSGSIRRTLPEGLRAPLERPAKRRRYRSDWRRSGFISAENNSTDELYDEAVGPPDPRRTVARSMRLPRSAPTSLNPYASERIMKAREDRGAFYEQFRDPKTGILVFPKKTVRRPNKRTTNQLLELLRSSLVSGELSDMTSMQVADMFGIHDKAVKEAAKSTGAKLVDEKKGKKRDLDSDLFPRKPTIEAEIIKIRRQAAITSNSNRRRAVGDSSTGLALRKKLETMSAGLGDDARNGLSMREVAEKYGLSLHYIRRELQRQNLKLIRPKTYKTRTPPTASWRRPSGKKPSKNIKRTDNPGEKVKAMRAGLLEDAQNGLSIDQVMKKYQVSSASVKNELRHQRLRLPRKNLPKIRQSISAGLADDARNGLSINDVMEKYNYRDTGWIYAELRKQNLKLSRSEVGPRAKYPKMRAGLASDVKNGLTVQEIMDKYDVSINAVYYNLRKQNLTALAGANKKRKQSGRNRVSGSMSWGRFNPPKPQLRDIGAELELENEVDEELSSRSIDKPETFNVAGIAMRQWNEFSSDMMAYLQESLTDPKFEYGDSKTQSRERRRSLMRAIAAIKQANVKKNEDGSLSMDFTDESIRRLRTVLRVLKEQDVESIRHIDLLRDNLPNKKSRRSQKSAWPTRTLINVKDGMGLPRVVRIGDPDVFNNQTSALKRSRDLGCIGIRRYSTANGELAWMPCTNESDYRRRRGVGPQAARDRKKREDELAKRIERRVGRLMRAKSAQIGILEKINKTKIIIEFIEKPSTYVDGKRFVAAGLRTVENNVG